MGVPNLRDKFMYELPEVFKQFGDFKPRRGQAHVWETADTRIPPYTYKTGMYVLATPNFNWDSSSAASKYGGKWYLSRLEKDSRWIIAVGETPDEVVAAFLAHLLTGKGYA